MKKGSDLCGMKYVLSSRFSRQWRIAAEALAPLLQQGDLTSALIRTSRS
jgi:hypothetical protein